MRTMRVFRVSLLFYFSSVCVVCRSVQLTVGALFNDGNHEAEMAFKYAILKHNLYSTDIKFDTVMENVSRMDTFATSKTVCNMISSDYGVVAVFGPPSPKTGSMVRSICSNFEIPYIQTSWNPGVHYSHQTILNFFPDHKLLSQGIATLVRHMNWKSYVILYEDHDSLTHLQEVLKIASAEDEPVIVRQLGDGPEYRPLLKEIKNSSTTQIILDCPTHRTLEILKQAKEVKLLDYFHSYLITSLDAHTLDFSVLDTRANITVVRIVDPDDHILHNAVRDWEQGESKNNMHGVVSLSPYKVKAESAVMYDAVSFFTTILPELHMTEEISTQPMSCDDRNDKWQGGFRISTFMKIRHKLHSITGPIKFDENGRRIDFRLQIAEINNGRPEKTATWSPMSPNTLNFTRSASEQMQQIVENLQKILVIVSSRIGPPYLRDVIPKDGEILEGNDRYEGFSKDLIYAISKVLNFTFRIELTADGKYGNYDDKTKSWNGLIKDLLERKAHLAICDLTITHQRREVVDFSMPFMTLGVSILHSKGKKQVDNKFAFMDPFGLEVWMYTATLYLGVSLLLYIIARMAPGDWENPHPCDQNPDELENIWEIKNCLWITLGSIMTQGSDILPKGISTRMGVSMWWFFSLIMTSSYTANLAAFLTMDKMAPTIDSADALVKQTKIKYGTVDGGSTQTFFKESNFSTYARMWINMVQARPSVFERTNAEGVKRVLTTKNQGYAFFMESSSLEYEVSRHCDLKQVGGRLDSKGYGIAMPMNSPYRGAINNAVLKLQEDGKLGELKKKWWIEKVDVEVPCGNAPIASGADLALANVGGVFIVLGMGIAIAFLLAFVEFLWNVRKVAIEEHIGFWEALGIECKFAVKVWITQKQVKPDISESTTSSRAGSETKSAATRTLKGGGFFLELDGPVRKNAIGWVTDQKTN